MKFKNKKFIAKNGITIFLTKEKLSFEKLSEKIQKIEVNIFIANLEYISKDITPHKVFTWAQGAIPKATEIQSLAYLKYKNTDRWLDVYIPTPQVAVYILKDVITKMVNKAFKDPEKLSNQITTLTYLEAFHILTDTKASQVKMATALIYFVWEHYIAVTNRSSSVRIVPSFSENSKQIILNSIYYNIDTINPCSIFVTELTKKLRSSVTLDDFDDGIVTTKVKEIVLPYIFDLLK